MKSSLLVEVTFERETTGSVQLREAILAHTCAKVPFPRGGR